MSAANPILITAKLYETRDAMRFLFGDRYGEKVKPLIEQLYQLSAAWEIDFTQTLIRVLADLQKNRVSGIEIAVVIAAYVEDVEGTFKEDKTWRQA